MSKHDIRLRRQKFTARGPDRFRNYGAVLHRHEKEMRIKKIVRVFTFLFIIMIIVMLIVIVVRVEKKAEKKKSASAFVQDDKKLIEASRSMKSVALHLQFSVFLNPPAPQTLLPG